MTFTFTPATREQGKARIALDGPSGAGKTFTALTLAGALSPRVAVIDTERGSASKYARGSSGDGFDFDTLQMVTYDPRDLIGALATAGSAGYGCVVVDSLSHFWMGRGGMLELVDAIGQRKGSGGGFGGWKEARPYERDMIDALLAYPGHVIVTMRVKSEWVIGTNKNGKPAPEKIGTKPEQRDGLEYEFDVVASMDLENTLSVGKTRCPALNGSVINRPDAGVAVTLLEWLSDGAEMADPATYLDRAVAADATVDGLRELHAEVARRQLVASAVLHPTTRVPMGLGAFIVERAHQLRAAAAQSATSTPTPTPLADPVRQPERSQHTEEPTPERAVEQAAVEPAPPVDRLPLLLDAIRAGWSDPAALAACRQTATDGGLLAREVPVLDGGTIPLHRMIDGRLGDLAGARPQPEQQSTPGAEVPTPGQWGTPQQGQFASAGQTRAIATAMAAVGVESRERARRLAIVAGIVRRPVLTMKELTVPEAGRVLDALTLVQQMPTDDRAAELGRYEAAAPQPQAA
ncbi:ATP-binding protein [Streptomyces sp. SID3343]|uniref:ATP-binding protein n=1 Tax=Streptomyces sp. SID3343 TaxID=2690260 RepID=UPI00136810B6|nr:ATP-binding protein [Streptomyces sp. SID3343]MYW03491.1 AAA family ATPase [Streptomyces sp. SID3343]